MSSSELLRAIGELVEWVSQYDDPGIVPKVWAGPETADPEPRANSADASPRPAIFRLVRSDEDRATLRRLDARVEILARKLGLEHWHAEGPGYGWCRIPAVSWAGVEGLRIQASTRWLERVERLKALAEALKPEEVTTEEVSPTAGVELLADDVEILRYLAESPGVARGQADIEAAAGLSRKTIGQRLAALRKSGLVKHPAGRRRGNVITAEGLRLLESSGT